MLPLGGFTNAIPRPPSAESKDLCRCDAVHLPFHGAPLHQPHKCSAAFAEARCRNL